MDIERPPFPPLPMDAHAYLFNNLYSRHITMGVGSGGQEEPWLPLDFIHNTDKAEGGLMVLFFGLVFPLPDLPSGNFSFHALAHNCNPKA